MQYWLHNLRVWLQKEGSTILRSTNCHKQLSVTARVHDTLGNSEDTVMEVSVKESFTETGSNFLDKVDEIMEYVC